MSNTLLPCPFCGGEAELYDVPHIPKGWDFIPRCKTTSCCGRQAKKYSNRETAIAAWNRRSDAAPVVRGEWKLLDECSNAGVYCSVCHKAVFRERAWYKNVHIQSKFCPNCGAKMEDKP